MSEQIIWKKCKKCGKIQYPTHLRCLSCKAKEFEQIEAKGDAKLLTFTILKAPPKEYRDKKSYALGIVEFENGVRALGQISTEKDIKTGIKLYPKYQKICENLDEKEVFGYVWYPDET